jgi:hypothetical protein
MLPRSLDLAGSCHHSNEPSGFLRDCTILTKWWLNFSYLLYLVVYTCNITLHKFSYIIQISHFISVLYWAPRPEGVLGSVGIAPCILWLRPEWSASGPGRFTSREGAPVTQYVGGWVDSRAVLDVVVKRKIPSPCRYKNPRSSSP